MIPPTPVVTGKVGIFFMEGDKWMCHPSDHKYMHVDTTWGILPPSGMHPSIFKSLIV